MKQEVKQTMAEQYKNGWCPIENKTTMFKRIQNGKWICNSGTCSYASGQYDKPPKQPKALKVNHLNFERRI